MPTTNKYSEIFKTALNIGDDKLNENLKYNEIEEWDSIAHMTLVAALEEEYKISLETDDIMFFDGNDQFRFFCTFVYFINIYGLNSVHIDYFSINITFV